MLTINYINIANIDHEIYHFFKKSVSRPRQQKADQYRFFDDAKRCILSELLLQYSYYQKIGTTPEINIEYNEFGKPFIQGKNNFSFNISHSGKWVVIAYGDVPVGVDIEKVCSKEEQMPIEAFTREERAYINGVVNEDRAKRFTQTWTLKESYVKYIGTGLSTDLNSFSIVIEDTIKVKKRNGVEEKIKLECRLLEADYYLSTCSSENKISMNEIKLIDLIDFAHNKNCKLDEPVVMNKDALGLEIR